MQKLITLLKGLALLRYPEVVRDLGERRFHLNRVAEIRGMNNGLRISSNIELIEYDSSRLILDDGISISSGVVLAFGDHHNGFGKIKVGKNTWVGQYNNLRAGGGDIVVGAHCLISQFCTLVASNHGIEAGIPIQEQAPDPNKSGVILGDDVWLGAGSTVTAGTTIGNGAVIGAGSVVTKSVPANEIWAGVPARKLADR